MFKNTLKLLIASLVCVPIISFAQENNSFSSNKQKVIFNDYFLIHNHPTNIGLSTNQQNEINGFSLQEKSKLMELKSKEKAIIWEYNQKYKNVLNNTQNEILDKLKENKIQNIKSEMSCIMKNRGVK